MPVRPEPSLSITLPDRGTRAGNSKVGYGTLPDGAAGLTRKAAGRERPPERDTGAGLQGGRDGSAARGAASLPVL